MSKNIILFITLLICSQVFAQIENINDVVKDVGSPQQPCIGCELKAKSTEPSNYIRECVEQICPDEKSSISYILDKTYHQAVDNPDYDQELKSLVDKIRISEEKNKIEGNKATIDWLKSNPTVKNRFGIKMYNLMLNLKTFNDLPFILDDKGKTKIDPIKLKIMFPTLSDTEISQKIKFNMKILSFIDSPQIKGANIEKIKLINGDKLKEKIDDTIDHIGKRFRELAQNNDSKFVTQLPGFKEMFSTEKLKAMFSGPEINPNAIDSLNNSYSFLDMFVALNNDQTFYEFLPAEQIVMKKSINIKETITKLNEKIKKSSLALQTEKFPLAVNCRTAYTMIKEFSPSSSKIESYKNQSKTILNNYLSNTLKYFSKHSSEMIKLSTKDIAVILPDSSEQQIAMLKKSLEDGLQESYDEKEYLQSTLKSSEKDSLFALILSTESIESIDDSAEEICKQFIPALIPDAASSWNNNFIMGSLVLKIGEKILEISNHELSHIIYGMLVSNKNTLSTETMKWFNESRQCLINNHSEFSPEEKNLQLTALKDEDTSKYDSEDWADLLSLANNSPDTNFACAFARTIDTDDYKSFSLKNADESDPHSSNFFRLLHLNFLKRGIIPDICQKALDAKGGKNTFTNCLLPSLRANQP